MSTGTFRGPRTDGPHPQPVLDTQDVQPHPRMMACTGWRCSAAAESRGDPGERPQGAVRTVTCGARGAGIVIDWHRTALDARLRGA
jgi:hypothetical protein